MTTKIDKIMERISLLLARADHPTTPAPEADLARERAEYLMNQYRIEESELSSDEKARQGIRPVDMEWVVTEWSRANEFRQSYYRLAYHVVNHVGAKVNFDWKRLTVDGLTAQYLVAHVFGFESDLRYGALLLNAAKAAFGAHLEPQVDPSLSNAENVYRLRNAGVERGRIGERMGWGSTGSAPAKVTRMFKKACEAHGEDPSALLGRENNVKSYRTDYADAFTDEINQRLWAMRNTRSEDGAMVLLSRQDEVNEMFWTAYPAQRPVPRERRVGSSEGTQCAKCAKAKSGYCREHGYRRPRYSSSVRGTNYTAASRGRDAASRVDLGPSGTGRIGR